ncbi:MAG: L-aspartate oxidase [Pyrinomonadaceae bacterium]|nr:L-aspartate oxidase [Pyrinomonadaceae bacterium]MCX7638858.1 L-aspartate oxidase [Pyrinomonadaceae bacterium]MDW8305006.1 L-aspartate oxidase [Acidobacteriota bacterium]
MKTDFVVIGSGIAGLRAAIEISRSGAQAIVLTKDRAEESNTEYAQGGIAVALSEEDNIELHEEDTIAAGDGLCDLQSVRTLVSEGPKYITELIQWGAEFDQENGRLLFTKEAAHSRRRILHAHGDSTGKEIVRALIEKAKTMKTLLLMPFAQTESLILNDNRCIGVRFLDPMLRAPREIFAKAVLLCTGGAGQIYLHTTNPAVATGDGISMAYLAGAEIADMEFVQFHPTVLCLEGAPRFLLSEAMRGEGGVLRNLHGERFMQNYDERLELAPRDIVSRSIVAEMRKTGSRYVFLDMTHLNPDFLRQRFPKIYETCKSYGLDITKELIPVSPASHYFMGGVRTDLWGRTNIEGLYAAGEVACTGIHGANRLASNSLLEGLVFGARAGKAAVNDNLNFTIPNVKVKANDEFRQTVMFTTAVKKRIKRIMWERVGIIRNQEKLQRALDEIHQMEQAKLSPQSRNFVTLAKLVATAAIWRKESRGGHFRSDFPKRNDQEWLFHSIQKLGSEISPAKQISSGEVSKTHSSLET